MSPPERSVLLFSYGTLQNKEVQLGNFGRELVGRTDALEGYVLKQTRVTDPTVLALSGQSLHPNLEPSSHHQDCVPGTVFEITAQELAAADQYEAASKYRRISVTLRSGAKAWVYLHS